MEKYSDADLSGVIFNGQGHAWVLFNKIQMLTRKEMRKISEVKLVVKVASLSVLITLLVLNAECRLQRSE